MAIKQPGLGSAILWGGGQVSGDGVVKGSALIWSNGAKVGPHAIRNLTIATWHSSFVDPTSMTDCGIGILAHGEDGIVQGLRIGPVGAWFYPPGN